MISKFKTTEKSVRLIEGDNTITVAVDRKDKKNQIKKLAEEMFSVKVDRVNTHIQGNQKLAYIKLNKKNPAIDVATKYGLI
jgi:ribosomal protein L23